MNEVLKGVSAVVLCVLGTAVAAVDTKASRVKPERQQPSHRAVMVCTYIDDNGEVLRCGFKLPEPVNVKGGPENPRHEWRVKSFVCDARPKRGADCKMDLTRQR